LLTTKTTKLSKDMRWEKK